MAALGHGGEPPAEGALAEAPADPPMSQPPAPEFERDDRGPGPLPGPREHDVPDAPVRVDDAPALVPSQEAAPEPPAETVPENIESVAARRIRRPPPKRKSRWPVPGWATAIVLLIAINIGLIALARRHRAGAAADGLALCGDRPAGEPARPCLHRARHPQGNPGRHADAGGRGRHQERQQADDQVPRLRFAVRNAKGHEIYSWTALPARNAIAPGATMPFRSRLASPPPEAHAVLVRFFNRRDLVAGVQ